MQVRSRVSVVVTLTLDGDEAFEATSPYGLKPRPVLIDIVKATGGSSATLTGSGRRINRDGQPGGLRASYVPLLWEQLPTEVRVGIHRAYYDAVNTTSTEEEWR
jgi:hypothetical protein